MRRNSNLVVVVSKAEEILHRLKLFFYGLMRQIRTLSIVSRSPGTWRINQGELILLHDRDGDILNLGKIQGKEEAPEANNVPTETRDGGGFVTVPTIEGDKLLNQTIGKFHGTKNKK